MDKLSYVNRLISNVNQLAKVMDTASDLNAMYFDLGYNGGGANQITDEDIASLGLTAADVVNIITLMQNYDEFTAGTNPINAVYRVTINKTRSSL